MARGKYAARAANTRAENAQQSATQLADLLAAERLEHARKVAELNGRIAQLQGRLDKEIKALAATEVQRVNDEWAQLFAAKADNWRQTAEQVIEILGETGVSLQASQWQRVASLLEVNLDGSNRAGRRATGKKLVATATRHELTLDREQRMDAVARGFRSLSVEDIRREADRRQAEVDTMRAYADEAEQLVTADAGGE